MKKILKWLGIGVVGLFVGLFALGLMLGEDETSETTTASEVATEQKTSDNTEEATEAEETETVEAEAEETSSNSKYAEYAEYHIPVLTDEGLSLSSTSYDFVSKNDSLFPAMDNNAIQEVKGMVDSTVTAKHLNKNANPYLEKVLSYKGTVISIEETNIEDTEDTVSVIHVMDDEGNSYQILLYKTTGDILEEDYVQFWGAPVGPSSFENISGGTTNVQFIMGSHLEKIS